jgi:hypothetical protein
MRARWFLLVTLLVAASCGGDDAGPTPFAEIDVPATIVGELEISVEEGPVGTDDISEVNFGSLETPDGPILIEVWADVVRAAGLSRDELVGGGRFRVELDEPAEYSPPQAPSYRVSTLVPAP